MLVRAMNSRYEELEMGYKSGEYLQGFVFIELMSIYHSLTKVKSIMRGWDEDLEIAFTNDVIDILNDSKGG